MRNLLIIIGLVALGVGIFWIGQGLGYINWPQTSFMINKTQWVYYGGGLSVVGLIFLWLSKGK